ncbi:interferon-inducible double-stranded RNA-dependent protein kinase activator A-like [Metopolophium dirhodum]|uniref:interferon-inducible double-stranded RNA-dependent protein kinase activator A-like n=1 Tax=Metopolophium dirhodum TaxID=44670 RepID=UPI00298FC6BF|nr:interferon-inducible double-stranded RNA-dependent protein kinase activator A-like [Metopolophium dirhodum]
MQSEIDIQYLSIIFFFRDIFSFKSKVRIELNPIGSLQELCVARHFPLPIYTFSDVSLQEHNPRYNVVCSISIYISSGIASTKKAAKKKAAYEMYKQIEKLTSEDVHEVIDNEFEKKDVSHKIVSSLCHETVTILKTFFGAISEPQTPHSQSMINPNKCKLTAVDALKKISERESFTLNCDVIYKNIDKVEVLLKANTTPIVVVSEAGKNENEAQESAAYFILAYLKIKLRI